MSEDVLVPQYAVLFSYQFGEDTEGYEEMDELTLALARTIPGYCGYESAKGENRNIFISYWASKEAIAAWRENATHIKAKAKGQQWYAWYNSMICKIEVGHFFTPDGRINLRF
ncbi:MAG: antibiotic biosynthesis monooxygenase [Schleiferiaceae bacterium]|nr:antibiotic biosynthesis monooxygenase [Schleiferiaceae bacterium]